jgi:Family of unknown function (DUF6526)
MASSTPQSRSNHRRIVPGFHVLTGGLLVLNLAWCLHRLLRDPEADQISFALVAVCLLLLFRYIRRFPIVVQDRVIRLEERLRLARLMPSDLPSELDTLRVGQLAALRFASDAELPGLVRRVLNEHLVERDAIKALISQWRSDELRV